MSVCRAKPGGNCSRRMTRCSTSAWSAHDRCGCGSSPSAPARVHPQDGRADERDHNVAHETGLAAGAEDTYQNAADERSDDAQDDVAEDAVAATAHHLDGEPARN